VHYVEQAAKAEIILVNKEFNLFNQNIDIFYEYFRLKTVGL
jgi:hypothetical protein